MKQLGAIIAISFLILALGSAGDFRSSGPAPKQVAAPPISKSAQNLPVPRPREMTQAKPPASAQDGGEQPNGDREAQHLAHALETFERIKELPGARDLAQDIQMALEDDPNALDFSALTEGPDFQLKKDYLVHMIPDPELRSKWVDLMGIIQSSGQL